MRIIKSILFVVICCFFSFKMVSASTIDMGKIGNEDVSKIIALDIMESNPIIKAPASKTGGINIEIESEHENDWASFKYKLYVEDNNTLKPVSIETRAIDSCIRGFVVTAGKTYYIQISDFCGDTEDFNEIITLYNYSCNKSMLFCAIDKYYSRLLC